MHYIYLELIRRFGLGKTWVNVPVGPYFRAFAFEARCNCCDNPVKIANWNPDNFNDHFAEFRLVMLLPVGIIRFPSSGRDLCVWAGACSGCDRVYFGLASKRGALAVLHGGAAY